jgi:hypothetical protein
MSEELKDGMVGLVGQVGQVRIYIVRCADLNKMAMREERRMMSTVRRATSQERRAMIKER